MREFSRFTLKGVGMSLCKDGFIFILCLSLTILCARPLFADDKTKNSSTQHVGGLLFDMDEGVKVEQGPGGSVYVKSNREYMQEKFKSLDEKIENIEKRLLLLEAQSGKGKPASGAASSAPAKAESGNRVLVT